MTGFMLYRKFYRVFNDKEVIGIIAEYESDKERSNKGGKSTILEAMRYGINGESRAEREIDLIHHGMDEMLVELVLISNEGKKHYIKRGRNLKGTGVIEADRITNAIEAQKYINELLGYEDTRDLNLTNFFKQNDINRFLEMKPAQMQKHLTRWFQNDHWSLIEVAAKADLKKLVKKKDSFSAKMSVLQDQLVDSKELASRISETKEAIEEKTKEKLDKKLELKKLEANVVTTEERKRLKVQLQEAKKEYERVLCDVEDAADTAEDIRIYRQTLRDNPEPKINFSEKAEKKLRRSMNELMLEQGKLVSAIGSAKLDHTGICPILAESCDRIKFNPNIVKGWEGQERRLRKDIERMQRDLRTLLNARDTKNKRVAVQNDLDLAQARLDQLAPQKAKLKASEAHVKKLEKQYLKGGKSGDAGQVLVVQDQIDEINNEIDSLRVKLGRLREQRKSQRQLQLKLDRYKELVTRLNRKIEDQRYVVFMFSKNGIPGQEIENGFDEIEDETNFILDKFGTGLSVMFNADRELKTWEPACLVCGTIFSKGTKTHACSQCGTERQKRRKDELAIRVLENGADLGFNMESGGGKTIVSFSNRLALSRMKQRTTGSQFNVLFLDEPDSALDKPNKRAFMDIVTTVLINQFGIQQIFWVTHDKTIQESTPHVLQVIRLEDHSKTRWLSC